MLWVLWLLWARPYNTHNTHNMLWAAMCYAQRAILWGEAGAPGGTVRRAAVRKRGSGSMSLYEHRLPD